jgi:DNA invertase Pin-like site-specific DNA recombinase
MLLGYMRVSKADGSQVLDLQHDALLAAGVAPDRLYDDHTSGRQDARPGLEACLKALRPGDTLVVWKLDRLTHPPASGDAGGGTAAPGGRLQGADRPGGAD